MMHLMEAEWAVLEPMLRRPELLAEYMPLMHPEELEARCDDIVESKQFNHHDVAEWAIMINCVQESDIHEHLPKMPLSYEVALDMIDAAYSLQDRFATRFRVDPNQWKHLVGTEVDAPIRTN